MKHNPYRGGINAWCATCLRPLHEPHDEQLHKQARLEQLRKHWPDWQPPAPFRPTT